VDELRRRIDEQVLVDNYVASYSSLEVGIEGMNITLMEYYESIRPPDIDDIA
jgi:hypothetical protein